MQKLIALVAVLTLLPSLVLAATIHGTVYNWKTLDPLNGSVVTINTVPQQTAVAKPSYTFNVPNGDYEIIATDTKTGYVAKETLKVSQDGDFTVDLLLTLPEADLPEEPDVETPTDFEGTNTIIIAAVVLALIYLIYTYYNRPAVQTAQPSQTQPLALGEDLRKALKIIQDANGRITQKDLRMKMPYSEAKVSLILDDLENRRLIKRFKKGRGNIIRIEGA